MVMELSQFLLLFFCLLPVVYLCLHKLTMRKKSKNGADKFPPGTSGWPVIGETRDYLSKVNQGALYKFLAERMNKYSSNTFRTSLLGDPMFFFSNAEANKFLFSNENKLVRVWFPSTLRRLFPPADYSRSSGEFSLTLAQQLKIFFKTDMLREFVGHMDAVMKKHLQMYLNQKQVNIGDIVDRYLFTVASKIFLGIDDPERIAKFVKETKKLEPGMYAIPINLPGTTLNRAIKASRLLREELEATIRQRRIDILEHGSASGKDLMSQLLLATKDNDKFSDDRDIASHLVGLLLGGSAPMYGTTTSIMKYLAELPDVYDSVLKEQKEILHEKKPTDLLTWEDLWKMKYSWNVVCEVLRLLSPGVGSFREALTDFTYEGYAIPRGSKIHWISDATHKNPKYFPDPEKFDPSRFQRNDSNPYTFVPFGGGPRMCPGNEYARLAILVFMHNVVSHFRWEKLNPDEKFLYFPAPRPALGLPVLLHPHQP